MNIKRYVINNVFERSKWSASLEMEFLIPNNRKPKNLKRRINDAIALLKSNGYIKNKEFQVLEYNSITVNLENISAYIMECHYDLIRRFDVKDCICLIGSKEFYALTKQQCNYPLRIDMADFQVNHVQNKLYGMHVIILPWMDGTVLVPKEYFPIDRELVPSGIMVKKVEAVPHFFDNSEY